MTREFTDNLVGLTDEVFLRTAYVTLLGRSADAFGVREYLARLGEGIPRQQVWTEISGSEEAQQYLTKRQAGSFKGTVGRRALSLLDLLALDGVLFITEAYRQVLGRDPDAVGLRDYSSRLTSGVAKEQILADMRSDPEGKAFAAPLAGLDDLVRLAQAGMFSDGTTATSTSLEELVALNGKAFVQSAYRLFFGRDADADGLARYCPLLFLGYSKLFVLDALYSSPEAREKNAHLPDLEGQLRAYHKAQAPSWGGWYWRHVRGVESDLPRDRELRAVLARLSSR